MHIRVGGRTRIGVRIKYLIATIEGLIIKKWYKIKGRPDPFATKFVEPEYKACYLYTKEFPGIPFINQSIPYHPYKLKCPKSHIGTSQTFYPIAVGLDCNGCGRKIEITKDDIPLFSED